MSKREKPAVRVKDICEMTGVTKQQLYAWREHKPKLWHIIIMGCLTEREIKYDEE